MTKRLTETQKWVDPWFRRLPPEFKLAWIYLTDNCDCAGVIDLDRELASFQIGFDVQWEKFFVEAGERIRKLASGKIWVTQFVAFQQGCDELNPENRFHRGIISRLLAAGINHAEFQGPSKPLASPKQGATKGQARPPIYIRKQDNKITVKQDNKKTRKAFSKPSLTDVTEYCQERQNTIDPEAFIAFYETNGWKQSNGNAIKNWKMAVVTWEKNRQGKSTPHRPVTFAQQKMTNIMDGARQFIEEMDAKEKTIEGRVSDDVPRIR